MASTESYISVYVPEYQGFQNQAPSTIKTKIRGIRRCWNRLSRLQRSFFFMASVMLTIFGLTVTMLAWTPQTNLSPLGFDGKGDSAPGRIGSHINQKNLQESPKLYLQDALKSEDIPERVSVTAKTSPDIPDFDGFTITGTEWGLKKLLKDKAAEDIRNVISLDPVIPIHLNRQPPTFFNGGGSLKPLKFEGPHNSRQQAVVDAFLHAWKGYKKFAWGRDHLRPISQVGGDWFGLGLSIVDSLDTMHIMNLQREFLEARNWVDRSLSFDNDKDVNLFETTIRILGGLLSAFHLSQDQIFAQKAQDLGSRLIFAFQSPSGIPYSDINLKTLRAHGAAWNPDSSTSEVTTLQLEFRDLSRITNISAFEQTAMNVSEHIHRQPKYNGLVPIHISPNTGQFRVNSVITLGARGDSYYEYLLKQSLQVGASHNIRLKFLTTDYLTAVEGIRDKLIKTTFHSNLTYVGELEQSKTFRPKMDHLVCFLPGTLALGVHTLSLPDWHLELAKSLLRTCYETYRRHPTGLSPEITYFRMQEDADSDFFVKQNDAHNLLRPEFVESLWYLHQITGDALYQEWGWEVFENFMKYTKVEHGFTSISSVLNADDIKPRDMMESFFLAETLKYFYLLFSDKPIFDLRHWVFNTEGHPLPIYEH